MKEKFQIEIADVPLSILSDEKEEYVTELVNRLDGEIRDMTVRNKRCSKMDAALLIALDYCSEKQKADKRIRNLEAQISLYDANLRRLREENAALAARLGTAAPAPAEEAKKEDEPAEAPAEAKAADAAPADKPADKQAEAPADRPAAIGKMRQLEMMLQGMKEDKN